MPLFIETHIIQNFAPSNLNRDDTGTPKDAIFGGHRRARISSQCLKRAARLDAKGAALLPLDILGTRTKKLTAKLLELLPEEKRQEAEPRIRNAFAAVGLSIDEEGMAQYLVYLGGKELAGFAKLIQDHWEALAPQAQEGKKNKKEAKASLPPSVKKEALALLDGGKAADVALFGRMLADLPQANIDAACQVAHAISTHKVDREFDYFTAMDDLASPEQSGAAMIETTEFNSACFYRYSAIDMDKLRKNLQEDSELALASLKAFLLATVRAIPSGKQNSFAAHNPPAFVGVALRKGAPRNLANAFETPVWPKREQSLSELSVTALARQEQALASAYGEGDWNCLDLTGAWPKELGQTSPSLDALAEWLVAQAKARG